MTGIINLLIVHGHTHFLFILHNIISSYQGLRVIGTAGTVAELTQRATDLKPDIIIADMALPGIQEFIIMQLLLAEGSRPKIILSWQYKQLADLNEAMAAGCAGYIVHDADASEYFQAAMNVMKGKVYYCRQTERAMGNYARGLPAPAAIGVIQGKNYDLLLHCIWLGFSNKQTAIATKLSEKTIATYRQRLKKMLGSLSAASIESIINEKGGR